MLAGQVAIVTGGSSGIGRAAALAFAREGAKVVVRDVDEAGGRETVADVSAAGGDAEFVVTDVTDPGAVNALVERAVERFGALHAMFNNAGIGTFAPLLDHTPEQFDRVVKVNQYGVFYGMVAAGRKMRELKIAGTIVNTASVYGFFAAHGIVGYHASKGAVRMMTQAAALELAPFGIRVVAIAPGAVDTPILQGYRDMGLEAHMARAQMRGKILRPEKIADVVVWLCSSGADSVNGSTVMCDDGAAGFKA
jgi:NAD(P)-dependent dehydrogenase (short-subunit alcohol dehydrogenase family)